ncbi:unnamed protein product [Cylindrotheca closterium]|uniref:Uncharacterized protein n=1 Tax=Cylindrotheca closterium TaxID=2856 RepID=A0AAD2G6J8_9STRA|nr:unnamed protein product [Cylindrotheca closterium]
MRESLQRQNSKEELLQQIGGESQFDFIIMTFCESIQEDTTLNEVFKGMHVDTMVDLMNGLLDAALEMYSSRTVENEDNRNRIVLKNYALFEMGLNKGHLEKMKVHYEAALRDSWVEDKVFDECMQRFEYLEAVFDHEGKEFEQTAVADKKAVSRFLNARCA